MADHAEPAAAMECHRGLEATLAGRASESPSVSRIQGPHCVTDTLACQATPPAQRQMSGAAADAPGYAVVQQFGQCAVGLSPNPPKDDFGDSP